MLLAYEVYGPLDSDNLSIEFWTFHRDRGFQPEAVDMTPLTAALKARWRALGRAEDDLEHSFGVHGWRRRGSAALIVEVLGSPWGSPPERMLPSYWLVEPDGSNPRWLAPADRPPVVRRFGRVHGRL